MSVSNGKITAPVSIADVASCLGVGSYDLGTLCANGHGKINQWSRMKPVQTSSPDGNIGRADWWKGEDGKCGLIIPPYTNSYMNIKGLMTADGKNGWGYIPPKDNFVLNHFAGYVHNATPPLFGFSVSPKVSQTGSANATVGMNQDTADPAIPGSLSIKDISSGGINIGASFFGIAVYDGETCKGRVTGNYAGSFTCEYPASSLVTGRTYTCYPFVCGKKKTIASAEEQDFYFTLPNVLPASFKVVSSMELNGIHVTLEARYSFYVDTGAENRSIILVSGNVYGDNGLSLTNNYLICRFMNSPENSAMQSGEKQVKLSDMNTSGTTPVKINQNFSGLDVKRDYVITLSLHSGAYKYKVDVMQQFPGVQI